ncbi:hypothetical protein [Flectobacillus major]|nr:hypothetical protein [Flectobacillus major]
MSKTKAFILIECDTKGVPVSLRSYGVRNVVQVFETLVRTVVEPCNSK